MFEAEGAKANDLEDGDDGCGGERVVRRRRVAGEEEASADGKRKRVEMDTLDLGDGRVWTWPRTKVFQIERLLDKRMVECQVGKGKAAKKKDYPQYLILWKDFPPVSRRSVLRGSGPCSAASLAASRVRWSMSTRQALRWRRSSRRTTMRTTMVMRRAAQAAEVSRLRVCRQLVASLGGAPSVL